MAMEGSQQSIAKRPAGCRKVRSGLVRRLGLAKDDPAKRRIRRWLSDINDERLSRFGLTTEDIALLRGSGRQGEQVRARQRKGIRVFLTLGDFRMVRVFWFTGLGTAAGAGGGFARPCSNRGMRCSRRRLHLLSRDVGLDTHVADVANLMIWENLRDIVLVGHSYGGIVARHVADRMPDRICSLIYLDAFVPDDGKALHDYLPDSGKHSGNWLWPTAMAGRSAAASSVLRGECGGRRLGGPSVHDASAIHL